MKIVNINELIVELAKRCRSLGVKISQGDIKIIIIEFISMLREKVFEGYEIKIKNFAIFELGKSVKRKLPNGLDNYEQKDIIKVKLSKNFKNK